MSVLLLHWMWHFACQSWTQFSYLRCFLKSVNPIYMNSNVVVRTPEIMSNRTNMQSWACVSLKSTISLDLEYPLAFYTPLVSRYVSLFDSFPNNSAFHVPALFTDSFSPFLSLVRVWMVPSSLKSLGFFVWYIWIVDFTNLTWTDHGFGLFLALSCPSKFCI